MADTATQGANVVISMPAQMFTRSDQFQSLFNGKIYIGQIDKDPRDPKNQIDVFIQQEDNSLLKVPQPLRTNNAGYPVYGGKIVKFVTTQGHSMLTTDQNDVQQLYFPNVLKYDPDQFSGAVGGPDGLKVIGRCESVDQLRTIIGVADQWISLASYTKGTHTGGGFFYWVNDILLADDGGTFFRVNSSGGWKRDKDPCDLTVDDFGAVPDGVTDVIPAIQRMHAWAVQASAALNIAATYSFGVVLGTGCYAGSSMDLGDTEINAFKLRGPEVNYGVIPRTVLKPLNATTTTPMFAFRARRMEISNICWNGASTVQPFVLNRVTRGSYSRIHSIVALNTGGRVFQVKDCIDTKLDQVYSYNGRAAFFVATWSNENPGAWNHSTAIELSNFNFTSHTGEMVFQAIRATQSMMYNGWFDRNENPFDISQGQWTLDNVTMENSTNPAAAKYGKLIEVSTRWDQGAGLSFDASGYDPSMDNGGSIPSWVTNAYDQGRMRLDKDGTLFKCGVAMDFEWANNLIDNSTTNADTWYTVGQVILPRLGDSLYLEIVGAANWDSATGTFDRPGGTAFGSGRAVIGLEMKQPNNQTTTSVEAHWYGEANSPIRAVKLVHTWQTLTVYVLMRQYAKYGAVFMKTTGRPRIQTGNPMYFRPDLTATPDINAVANILDVPAKWAVNKGDYGSNGLGVDLEGGNLVMYQSNKTSQFASEFMMVMHNGQQKYVQLLDKPVGMRYPWLNKAALLALSPSTYVGQTFLVNDARGTPGQSAPQIARPAFSDGFVWMWNDDLSLVT